MIRSNSFQTGRVLTTGALLLIFGALATSAALASASGSQASPAQAAQQISSKTEGKTCEVAVEGMTCKSCVAAVTKALKQIKGAENIKVVLSENKARLFVRDATPAVLAEVEQAIKSAGFKPGKAEFVQASGG